MKKLLSVLSMLLMAVMTISSCSSDDDEAFDNAVILGTWTTNEDVIEGGEYVPDMEMQVKWTFKADNTASERMYIKMNNIINEGCHWQRRPEGNSGKGKGSQGKGRKARHVRCKRDGKGCF